MCNDAQPAPTAAADAKVQSHSEMGKAFLSAHPSAIVLSHPHRLRIKASNYRVARAKAVKI